MYIFFFFMKVNTLIFHVLFGAEKEKIEIERSKEENTHAYPNEKHSHFQQNNQTDQKFFCRVWYYMHQVQVKLQVNKPFACYQTHTINMKLLISK